MATEKTKLYIDTDMGGDCDDALALVCALNNPAIELVGVGTVYLRPEFRAQVTCDLLARYGKPDVPVAVGCARPIIGEWDEACIPDSALAPETTYPISNLHAADLLVQAAKENPGLVVLAIGPLTNVALAILKAPEVMATCRIAMMGGQIFSFKPEWNIVCDPEAAHVVFESGIPLLVVPFDVTEQCQFTQNEVDEFGGTPNLDLLHGMMNRFTQRFGFLPMMHDPMALAMVTNPGLYTWSNRTLHVELHGQHTRGTIVDKKDTPHNNAQVAVAADLPAFRTWVKAAIRGNE